MRLLVARKARTTLSEARYVEYLASWLPSAVRSGQPAHRDALYAHGPECRRGCCGGAIVR